MHADHLHRINFKKPGTCWPVAGARWFKNQPQLSTGNTDFDKANLSIIISIWCFTIHLIYLHVIVELSDTVNSLHAISTTIVDAYESLISLCINKPANFDNISPKVLQSCIETLCEPFIIYSLCYYVMPLYNLVGLFMK